jgi:hypothetical protein
VSSKFILASLLRKLLDVGKISYLSKKDNFSLTPLKWALLKSQLLHKAALAMVWQKLFSKEEDSNLPLFYDSEGMRPDPIFNNLQQGLLKKN